MRYMGETGTVGRGRFAGRCRGPCGAGMRRGNRRNAQMPQSHDLGDERAMLESELKAIDHERKAMEERLKQLE